MKQVISGVAVIALAAAAAQAGPGNGNRNGNGVDRGKSAQGQSMKESMAQARPGGQDKPEKGGRDKAAMDRGNSGSMKAQVAAMRGEGNREGGGRGNGNARTGGAKEDPGNGNSRGRAAADRGPGGAPPPSIRGNGGGNSRAARAAPGISVLDDGRRAYRTRSARGDFAFGNLARGVIDGCPPGLAMKNNGCMPPGQVPRNERDLFAGFGPDWWGLGNIGDGRYFYDDGYLLRLNGDRVAGYVPLFGGALSVGNPWPGDYAPLTVPDYYVDYYGLGPSGSYRYADNVIYRVDPGTTAITSVAALLTGNDIAIGSPMPAGYDVYNVPYSYRSRYRDGPDALYRYDDGYIYRIDPATRLVTAAIELIAG